MTTTNLILAIVLIVLGCIALFLIFRYLRKANDLRVDRKALEEKQASLEKWRISLHEQQRKLRFLDDETAHVYYNVTVEDPSGTIKHPGKKELKAMKSGIGYKLVPFFENNITATYKDGKTTFSLDVDVRASKKNGCTK